MKRFIFLPALAIATLSASAQDIYRVEQLAGSDLNGTARYVGMGGAMNVLGADLSTINTNPAGIGAFRRSDISATASLTTQSNAEKFYDIGKSRLSFDQVGFVYATKMNGKSLRFLNFGFNYHKQRNFKNFFGLNAVGTTNGLSQSDQMAQLSFVNGDVAGDLTTQYNSKGEEIENPNQNKVSPLAVLGANSQMVEYRDGVYTSTPAQYYNYHRVQWGGIHAYDFNISANWNDQIYAGLTFGIYDVNFRSGLAYDEYQVVNGAQAHDYHFYNEDHLEGSGFDVKLGVLLRPVETSPFRIGFTVSTPTWYDLSSYSAVDLNSPYGSTAQGTSASVKTNLDYKIRTPWKFGLSLGTTIGRNVAVDAEYEVADYSGSSISYPDYSSYDYWSGTYANVKDNVLKNEINSSLKAVHTFRIGAEARLANNLYGRVGYNYVTKAFKDNAYLNLHVQNDDYYSPSFFYQSHTDYVNLGDINRFTIGLGYRTKHFYIDAAYQYQTQKADVYAFYVYDTNIKGASANLLNKQSLDLNRSNFMVTVGYKF